MNELFGFKVIISEALTEPGEPYDLKRTLNERLFSRPWNPFKAWKTITPMVPMKKYIRIQDNIIMHPIMLNVLKEQLRILEVNHE